MWEGWGRSRREEVTRTAGIPVFCKCNLNGLEPEVTLDLIVFVTRWPRCLQVEMCEPADGSQEACVCPTVRSLSSATDHYCQAGTRVPWGTLLLFSPRKNQKCRIWFFVCFFHKKLFLNIGKPFKNISRRVSVNQNTAQGWS